MIAKISKGSGFRGLLDYLLKDGRGAIVGGNLAGVTARELSKEFGASRRLRQSLGKAVAHVSLSVPPGERKIEDEEWSNIAEKVAIGLGFYESSRVLIKHTDTDHQHVHLVLCRVDRNGQTVKDSNDYRRTEAILRRIEIDHELTRVTNNKKKKEIDTMETGQAPTEKATEDFLLFSSMDQISPKAEKEARREATTQQRREELIEKWGELFTETASKNGVVRYTFEQGEVIDEGSRVKAKKSDDAIRRLLTMARVKGWSKIAVSGPIEMVLKAVEMAKRAGLIVFSELTSQPLLSEQEAPTPRAHKPQKEEAIKAEVFELSEHPKIITKEARQKWMDNRLKGVERHDEKSAENKRLRPR